MKHFEFLDSHHNQTRHLTKGETLFHAGDKISHMYVIQQGKLRMVRYLNDGTAVTFHLAQDGQLFAEASLFAAHYHCDGIVEEDCTLAVYSKPDLLAALEKDPGSAFQFMAYLARQIQSLRSQVELIKIKSATERVLLYLQNTLPPGSHETTLHQSWKSVAAEIGLTHEALYRALAALQKSNMILRTGRKIQLVVS